MHWTGGHHGLLRRKQRPIRPTSWYTNTYIWISIWYKDITLQCDKNNVYIYCISIYDLCVNETLVEMRDSPYQQYKTLYIPILLQLCPNVYNYFSQAEILQAIGEDLGSWFSKHISLWDLGHFNSKITPVVRVIKHLDVWYSLLHLPKWVKKLK